MVVCDTVSLSLSDVSYHNSSISNYYKNESCSDFIFVCGIPSNIQTVDNCPNEVQSMRDSLAMYYQI